MSAVSRVIGMVCLMVGLTLLFLSPCTLFAFFRWADFFNAEDLKFLGLIIHLTIFMLLFGLIFPHLFANLSADDKGIYVQFYLEWLFVPWENIVSIRESRMSKIYRLFLPFVKKGYFVSVGDKLTLIHCLVSANQSEGWRRGVLISRQISDYDELIELIEAQVAKQKDIF